MSEALPATAQPQTLATLPELKALSPKRRRFVLEYSVDWNATQAAIRAGFGKTRAPYRASALLKIDKVARAVEAIQDWQANAIEWSRRRIFEELQVLAGARITDYGEFLSDGTFLLKDSTEIPPELMGAVKEVVRDERYSPRGELQGVKCRLVLHPKMDALRLLAQVKIAELREQKVPPAASINIANAQGGKVAVQINQVVAEYDQALEEAVRVAVEARTEREVVVELADTESRGFPVPD